jgi:hypothetical protein
LKRTVWSDIPSLEYVRGSFVCVTWHLAFCHIPNLLLPCSLILLPFGTRHLPCNTLFFLQRWPLRDLTFFLLCPIPFFFLLFSPYFVFIAWVWSFVVFVPVILLLCKSFPLSYNFEQLNKLILFKLYKKIKLDFLFKNLLLIFFFLSKIFIKHSINLIKPLQLRKQRVSLPVFVLYLCVQLLYYPLYSY